MHPNASPYEEWVQAWLTADRFKTYLKAAGNDNQRAFDLYQWNTAINSALLHDFAHLEVLLRNVLHREMQNLVSSDISWLAAHTVELLFPVAVATNRAGQDYDANKWLRSRIQESRRKFGPDQPTSQLGPRTEGQIIADLTFGVWPEMLHSRFEESLWTQALHKAFSPGIARRDVYSCLSTLRKVRNRMAHHEPNLRNVNKAHRDLFWLLSVIDRKVQAHVRVHSSVGRLLKAKP